MKTEKNTFYRKLFGLVLPIAVQNLMTALVSASDALMLGTLDQNSLAAVSLATQITFVLNLFYAALIIGTTTLAAQYWGKGDARSVEEVLGIALRLSAMVSAIFFLAAGIFPQLLMRIFTAETVLIDAGNSYLRIAAWSWLFSGVSQIYLCIMKNSGRTVRSTIYGSVAVLLNLFLNAVLIFGLAGFPALGIRGAAFATVIARGVELLLVLIENLRTDVVRFRWKYIRSHSKLLRKDFIHYTSPVMANELVWGCGFTMFTVIIGRLGSDAIAANAIANIAKNILACFALGIGSGSSIIIGNELGAGNLEQARIYGRRLCHISLIAGIASGMLLLALKPVIFLAAGNLSAQAGSYLNSMLYVCAYYMIGKAMNATVIAGIFCAGGDTRFGFLCDTVTMWVIVVPIGLLAAFVLKLPVMAVYVLLNCDELIKLPAVYHHYKKYKWIRNLTIDKEETNEQH